MIDGLLEYFKSKCKEDFINKAVLKCYYDYTEWSFNNEYKPVGKNVFKWEVTGYYKIDVIYKSKKNYFIDYEE